MAKSDKGILSAPHSAAPDDAAETLHRIIDSICLIWYLLAGEAALGMVDRQTGNYESLDA